MVTKQERERRKAIVQAIAVENRRQAEAQMPLSQATLNSLFDWLDETADEGCDGTRRRTRIFLQQHSLPEEPILEWLMEYGGGCDCEVLCNVEEAWGERGG